MAPSTEPNQVNPAEFWSRRYARDHKSANNHSGNQQTINQTGNSKDSSNGFATVTSSGLGAEPGRFPMISEINSAAPGQRDAGMMSDSVFAHMLAPLSSNGNQASGSLEATDQQLAVNANGMVRQLFNQTPVASHNTHTIHRSLTPTQEDLKLQLQNFGVDCDDIMSGDILEAARRRLNESSSKQGVLVKKKAVSFPNGAAFGITGESWEPGLSDASSDGTEPSGEPTTPIVATNPNGFHEPTLSSLSTGSSIENSPQSNGVTGANMQPDRVNSLKAFGNSSVKALGQIDPYIPVADGSGFSKTMPDNKLPIWPSLNNGAHNGKFIPGHGKDFGSLANTRGQVNSNLNMSPVTSYSRFGAEGPSASPRSVSSGLSPSKHMADYHPSSLRLHNENLKGKVQQLENLLRQSENKLEYACNLAMRNITIREAEIAGLRRQIRQQGLRPFNEVDPAGDSFFEKELGMLFRMLCCWGKRFYKFPTGERLPRNLQAGVSQICEDPNNEHYLMNKSQTKYLIVVGLAARWMVDEILNPHFLDMVVGLVKTSSTMREDNALREAVDVTRDNRDYDNQLFDTIQEAASKRASLFVDAIHPLMSRPHDKVHLGQTQKQFIQVSQHAARIVLDTAKKDSSLYFRFPRLGEPFTASVMKEVTGDTLGLDVAAKTTTSIWHELHSDLVRLSILPHVTACIMEKNNTYRQVEAYKANVLLF
ncbi:hypothetical protein K440DRAFT_682261 [Wilcoxina mikolae CBS 423.85]|nr:hypothetical protein K440DRAFT_682261 [Wilcoxina mikolae CBS 423.85]